MTSRYGVFSPPAEEEVFSASRRKWQASRLRYPAAGTIRKSAGKIFGWNGVVQGV
jgi:hypothetical protein